MGQGRLASHQQGGFFPCAHRSHHKFHSAWNPQKTTKETSTETTSEGLIPDDTTQIWVFDGKDPDAPIPTKDPSISNLRISQASIALGQSKYDTKKKKRDD
ncbi:uncharacterized protein LOC26535376 [Drosophila yakuba]|uniref:Uncharacterized protein n=1 Tax=Drosophila yakuba TaxID=7245 RepID=A0A0R1E6I1_DROYA|nr:uncharacterized protein LOC26535376 [Drosophila yakuba]KRK04797.1 uncharacterized protein Dyak_GE28195 [Drosophila yakuba]